MPDARSFYLADSGERFGPLQGHEIVSGVQNGRFSKGSLIWRAGWTCWRPLAADFKVPDPQFTGSAFISDFGTKTKSQRLRGGGFLPWGAGLGAALLLLAASTWAFYWASGSLGMVSPKAVMSRLYLGLGAGSGLGTLSFVLLGLIRMKGAGAIGRTHFLRALATIGAFGVLIYGASQLRLAPLVSDTATQALKLTPATITANPRGDQLLLSGSLDPRAASRFMTALAAHSGVTTVVLDSPGGVVDQGFQIAKAVETRGLITLVHRECVSACTLIFVSGRQRLASLNAVIAFHAVAPLSKEMPHITAFQTAAAQEATDAYLGAHGVSGDILAKTDSIGPGNINPVHVEDLLDAHVVTGLVDSRFRPIGVQSAKWALLQAALRPVKNGPSVIRIINAVREADPESYELLSSKLFSALRAGDGDEFRSAFSESLKPLLERAYWSLDGEMFTQFISNRRDDLGGFVASQNWDGCSNFINGSVNGPLSERTLERNLSFEAAAIRYAGARNWRRSRLPDSDAAAEATSQAVAIGRDLEARYLGETNTDRDSCLAEYSTFRALSEMPSEKASGAYESIRAG